MWEGNQREPKQTQGEQIAMNNNIMYYVCSK